MLPLPLGASEREILAVKGAYLAYSYDFNQIYGRSVAFNWAGYTVSSARLKIDIKSRQFYALGSVKLMRGETELQGDDLVFNPETGQGTLTIYGESLERQNVGTLPAEEGVFMTAPQLDRLTLDHIQSSLLYCTCPEIQIMDTYEVYGSEVTFYVESLPSLSFTRFKLSDGIDPEPKGFSLDKVWYTKSQGLIGQASYQYNEGDLISSFSNVHYEERSLLKDYPGPQRQVDLMHTTTLLYDDSTTLGFNGNYSSSRLWNTNIWINKKWSERITTGFDFAFNKPVNYKGEAWFGTQVLVSGGKYGDISLSGRSDLQDQMLGNMTYGATFAKSLNVLLNSNYSRIKISGNDDYSEILSSTLSLSHYSKVFNLSADYFLNQDLVGSESLSRPQLRVGINPLTLYAGLLSFHLDNILIYSQFKTAEEREQSYNNNTVVSLATHPLSLPQGFSLDFRISVEQFVEKAGRNFTSGGFILNLKKTFLEGLMFETFYSTQSRRRTQNWLIEGTTSQDLSLILRANPTSWLDGWASLSYDPKSGAWQQSFADLSVTLFRNWRFHSLLNYDFLLRKLSNIDLYLIRDAGRFQLKFVWRSLSKQFLVELIPL